MSKQIQLIEKLMYKKNKRTPNLKPGSGAALLAKLPNGQIDNTDAPTPQRYEAQLTDHRLPTVQRQMLAAQIGRVQGNRHLQQLVTAINSNDAYLQRQDDEEEEPSYQLEMPSLRMPGALGSGFSLGVDTNLHLDPDIAAQIQAMQFIQQRLDPDIVRSALLEIDPELLEAPNPAFSTEPSTPQEPLVPAGAGPTEPRAGTGGDLMRAIMGVPVVDQGLTQFREQTLDQVKHGWHRMSTGEQIATVSAVVLVGGGALAGTLSNPTTRNFMLNQLNGRVLPVPGVSGLRVELNTERDNLMLGLHLDVGSLLPESWGFGPSSPRPIGGPPGSQ